MGFHAPPRIRPFPLRMLMFLERSFQTISAISNLLLHESPLFQKAFISP